MIVDLITQSLFYNCQKQCIVLFTLFQHYQFKLTQMSQHSDSQSTPEHFHIDQDSHGNQAIFIPIWQNTDQSVNNNQSVLLRQRQQQIRMYKSKILHLQRHLEDYDRNFESLYVALNEATSSEKLTKKELMQQRAVIGQLKLQRESVQSRYKMLGEQMERQRRSSQQQLQLAKNQVTRTKAQNLTLQGQLNDLRTQMSSLSSQQRVFEQKHQHNTQRIKELTTEIAHSIQQNISLQSKIRNLQEQLVKQKRKSTNLQHRLLQTQRQLDEININVNSEGMKREQVNVANKEQSMMVRIQELEQQLKEWEQKGVEKDRLIKRLQREVVSLQQRFKRLSQASIQSKRVVSVHNKKCQQCEQLNFTVRELQQQLNNMQAKHQDISAQLKEKQDDSRKAIRQLQRLKRQCERHRKQQQRAGKLVKKHELQIQRLQGEMQVVREQMESVKQELGKQREERQCVESEMEKVRRQINAVNKDKGRERLVRENERLGGRVEELEGELKNAVEVKYSEQQSIMNKGDHSQCTKELQVEKAKMKTLQAEVCRLKVQLQKAKSAANILACNSKPAVTSASKQPQMDISTYQQQYQQQLQSLRRQFQLKRYSNESTPLLPPQQSTQDIRQQHPLHQPKPIDTDIHEYYQCQIRTILRQLQTLKLQNARLKECVVRLENEMGCQKQIIVGMGDVSNKHNVVMEAQSRLCVNCHLTNDQLIHCEQRVAGLNQEVYQLRCLNEEYLSTILSYEQTYQQQLGSAKSITGNTTARKQLLSQIEFYKLELRKLESLFKQQQQQLTQLSAQKQEMQVYYQTKIMNKQEEIKLLLVRIQNMQLCKENVSYHASTTNSPSRVLGKQGVMGDTLLLLPTNSNSCCYGGGYQHVRGRLYNKAISSKRQSIEKRVF